MANAIILGIGALVISGCDTLPQEKIDAAKNAVDMAKQAESDQYAVVSFKALEDSLDAALETVEMENSGFIKNFEQSISKLDYVTTFASEVIQEAETEKEAIKTEIATILSEIKTINDENKLLISSAPTGKEGTVALMAIKGEVETVDSIIAENGEMFSNELLIPTRNRARAVKDKANAINSELKTVISKYQSAVRK